MYYIKRNAFSLKGSVFSLRRLEVVGKRENGRARGVPPSRARIFLLCVYTTSKRLLICFRQEV